MENETGNGTVVPPVDLSRLIDLIQQVFHKPRSIVHLVSSKMEQKESEPKIQWDNVVKQGNLSYNASLQSVIVYTSALYYITVKVKFRAALTSSNQMENTTVQFYLNKNVQNHKSPIESYKKAFVFHKQMTEYDVSVHTIAQLYSGDEIFVEVPNSPRKYLSPNAGSHRLSIFELS